MSCNHPLQKAQAPSTVQGNLPLGLTRLGGHRQLDLVLLHQTRDAPLDSTNCFQQLVEALQVHLECGTAAILHGFGIVDQECRVEGALHDLSLQVPKLELQLADELLAHPHSGWLWMVSINVFAVERCFINCALTLLASFTSTCSSPGFAAGEWSSASAPSGFVPFFPFFGAGPESSVKPRFPSPAGAGVAGTVTVDAPWLAICTITDAEPSKQAVWGAVGPRGRLQFDDVTSPPTPHPPPDGVPAAN